MSKTSEPLNGICGMWCGGIMNIPYPETYLKAKSTNCKAPKYEISLYSFASVLGSAFPSAPYSRNIPQLTHFHMKHHVKNVVLR
jgi:hypothetical protein